mgnify:CR=1 FL=1
MNENITNIEYKGIVLRKNIFTGQFDWGEVDYFAVGNGSYPYIEISPDNEEYSNFTLKDIVNAKYNEIANFYNAKRMFVLSKNDITLYMCCSDMNIKENILNILDCKR